MRDIPVGNGSLLVTFDDKYQIRDIYFPHVGQENQTEGAAFRFGIWVDDEFSWLSSDDWSRDLRYLDETLVTDVRLVNESLGIEIICNDTVASHENIFLRRFNIINNRDTARNVRVFLHEDFRLYENKVGDTVYFDPLTKSLIHYQKSRYFLIKSDPPLSSFATGRKDFQGHEGTWRDAEDGVLQGAAITEGSADSTICIEFALEPNGSAEAFYWIAAGKSYDEVKLLDDQVAKRTPDGYIDYTGNYWRAWVNKNDHDISALAADTQAMFKRSLLIVHTQIDNGGAIIAANDWDVTLRATDHYSYLWTRDGALVANALDRAGFSHLTRKFFRFCETLVHPDGYFLQKYNADGTVASGWHAAWDPHSQTSIVPIQEDETALVLWALWEHYQLYRDIEFAHRLYRSVTVPCADFMAAFIDEDLGLPKPSWNLWEDRRGIHTFTCATVVAGLRAAANFAVLFAEHDPALKYSETANRILIGMREHLYSEKDGRFLRSLQANGDGYEPDATVDASLFGTFYFDCFEPSDPLVTTTMSAIEEHLSVPGGIARFENDGYMRISDDGAGNAWVICTLWLAEYYIAKAQSRPDLDRALAIIRTVQESALASGVMGEQINPETNGPVSVSPLTWSHSSFVAACVNYCRKNAELL